MIHARRIATLLVLLLVLPACHGKEGKSRHDRDHDKFLRDTVVRIRDYQPPPIPSGWQAECLGRLAFAVPVGAEWATDKPKWIGPDSQATFHDGIKGERRSRLAWEFNEILVSPLLTEAELAAYRKHNQHDTAIRPGVTSDMQEMVDEAKKKLKEASAEFKPIYIDRKKKAELYLEQARSWHRLEPALGLEGEPDAYAIDDGFGLITIRLLRNHRLYTFVRGNHQWRKGDPRLTKLVAGLKNFVARFHARKAGEIPTEPGVCIPYGFIADDGQGDYETTATVRFPKHPGVTYTITTGLKHASDADGALSLPMPAPVKAISYMGPIGGALRGHDVKPQSLHSANIGPYEADAGGFSLNAADKGEPEVRTYQEFVGEEGLRGWQIWPLIHVTMDSKTRMQVPSLKENPPPQEESEATFERFLSGFHFRPTQPPTDEFARRLQELTP